MDDDRFWALMDLLDGVATDRSVADLDAALASSGEGTDFAERMADAVEALVGAGSATDLLAAAVIARGRTHYEAVLAAVGPGGTDGTLDPDDYDWHDAEALLVAGAGAPAPVESGDTAVDADLRWESAAPADGSEAWDEALRRVTSDPGLAGRLRAAGTDVGTELRVCVRDVEEPDWLVTSDPQRLALVVPAADLVGLVAAELTDLYVEILGALVIRAEEHHLDGP